MSKSIFGEKIGKGWSGDSIRHSLAKRSGKAGPIYRGAGRNMRLGFTMNKNKIAIPKSTEDMIASNSSLGGQLPGIIYKWKEYVVDFKLGELRGAKDFKIVKFTEIKDGELKKELRRLRFYFWSNEYIHGIDD